MATQTLDDLLPKHIPIKAELVFDLKAALTMQGISEKIFLSYPKDPTLKVVGIGIPVLNIECKHLGIIDPIGDIKEAAVRLYNHLMKLILKPVYEILNKLFKILQGIAKLAKLELKIPVFNLKISDLWANDLYDKIKKAVLDLWNTSKEKLIAILKKLGITWPFYTDTVSTEKIIERIVKAILHSIWDVVFKFIVKLVELIQIGLTIYDQITKYRFRFSITWKSVLKAILQKILAFLAAPPTIQEIYDKLVAFAKKLFKKAVLTYQDLIEALKKFALPIIGKLVDWILPLNKWLKQPNVDFAKLLTDIKIYISNFLTGLVAKFIGLVARILKFFGLNFILPKIKIPITLCAIKITPGPNVNPAPA
jgi:hypothetical protein